MTFFNDALIIAAITMIPFLELRASIPYGIFILKMHWFPVFIIACLANILLGPIVYFFLDKLIHLFLKIRFINRIYQNYVEKTQVKIHRYVEKYGKAALAVFIGIPLPGSGSYTGALAAYILGFGYRRFIIANIFGVLIAGIIVTIVTLTGAGAFEFFIRRMS